MLAIKNRASGEKKSSVLNMCNYLLCFLFIDMLFLGICLVGFDIFLYTFIILEIVLNLETLCLLYSLSLVSLVT